MLIDSVEYYDYFTSSYNWRGNSMYCWNTKKSLGLWDDATEDTCLITFRKMNLSVVVPNPSYSQSNFISISTSLPDHTINFTLPSSTHPETLFIYDILGREAARLEIASGMTQYSMNSSRFPSGHYFARLGNNSSHFVIE